MSCQPIAFLVSPKSLRLPEIYDSFICLSKRKKSFSLIFLQNTHQSLCFIFTGRLMINPHFPVIAGWKIFLQIHASCVTEVFCAGCLLHTEHLSINGISYYRVTFFIDLISVRIQKGNETYLPPGKKLLHVIKLFQHPSAFPCPTVFLCHAKKTGRHMPLRSVQPADTKNHLVSLSHLDHGNHPFIMTVSNYPELRNRPVSPGSFPEFVI